MLYSKTNSAEDNFNPTGGSPTSWHALSLSEIEQNLGTQIGSGLTRARAEELLRTHGPNKIPEAKVDSLLVLFLRQFKSPLIFILLAASGAVFYLGEIIDGAIILFVLIFNRSEEHTSELQ